MLLAAAGLGALGGRKSLVLLRAASGGEEALLLSAQLLVGSATATAAHRSCALLNDLALDRETAVAAAEVRADLALPYRLLRHTKCPAIGLPNGVDTVWST